MALFQFGGVTYLHSQSWYVPHNVTELEESEETDDSYVCHDNYALFIIQVFQYVGNVNLYI